MALQLNVDSISTLRIKILGRLNSLRINNLSLEHKDEVLEALAPYGEWDSTTHGAESLTSRFDVNENYLARSIAFALADAFAKEHKCITYVVDADDFELAKYTGEPVIPEEPETPLKELLSSITFL